MSNYNIGTNLTLGSYQALAADQISVLSDNISNAGTAGYKPTEFSFQSALANANMNVGNSEVFTQGAITNNSNPMDVAINGNGFFVTKTLSGQTNYTRAGQFSLDTNGNLMTATGQFIQGTDGKNINPLALAVANAPAAPVSTAQNPNPSTPSYTGFTIGANGGIQIGYSDGSVVQIPPAASQSENVIAVSSLGNENLSAAQIATSTTYTGYSQGANGTQLNFSDGTTFVIPPMSKLIANPGPPSPITGPIANPNGDGTQVLQLAFTTGTTVNIPAQVSAGSVGFSINNTTAPPSLTYTNGNGSTITNVSMDSKGLAIAGDGSILATGVPSSPITGALGGNAGIALVNFTNPNGLMQTQPGVWAWTVAASPTPPPLSSKPGDPGLGSLQSSSLETSSTDVTTTLVNLLIAQRQYQATAQALKTEDQDLTTIINLH